MYLAERKAEKCPSRITNGRQFIYFCNFDSQFSNCSTSAPKVFSRFHHWKQSWCWESSRRRTGITSSIFFTIHCIFFKSLRRSEIPGIFLCSEITGLVLVKGSEWALIVVTSYNLKDSYCGWIMHELGISSPGTWSPELRCTAQAHCCDCLQRAALLFWNTA